MPLVHFSTDYVFNGSGDRSWREDSPTEPLSAYGASKRLGEEAVLAHGRDGFRVVRTSWVFGPGGRNFPRAILDRARSGQPLAVVTDQIGRPTFTCDLAEALLDVQESLAALDLPEPHATDAEGYRVVLCNAPPADAARIAAVVVQERLAACVNILSGVQSVYVWEGAVHHDAECTLLIKTTATRIDALTRRLLALHPYELPEVIALPITPNEGSSQYLRWVASRVCL